MSLQNLMTEVMILKMPNMPTNCNQNEELEEEEEDSYTEMDESFTPHIKEERSQSLVEFPTSVQQTLQEENPSINFNFIVHGMPYGSSTFIQQHFGIHSWQRALALEGQSSTDSLQDPVICNHLESKSRKISACSQTSTDSDLSEVWNLSLSCECCKKIYKYLEFPEDCNNNVDDPNSSPGKYMSNDSIYSISEDSSFPKIIQNGLKDVRNKSLRPVNIEEDRFDTVHNRPQVPHATKKEDIDEALQWLRNQIVSLLKI